MYTQFCPEARHTHTVLRKLHHMSKSKSIPALHRIVHKRHTLPIRDNSPRWSEEMHKSETGSDP